MTPYVQWATLNPTEDAAAKPGQARGGMQWFEDNGAFPRMFYKVGPPQTDSIGNVTNLFDGTPYMTMTANDADEAGVLSAEGWHETREAAVAPVPNRGAKAS
jgi:hypothetical protein